MAVNPYQIYKQQEVLSAGRGELLLLLYDGCIKQMKLARLNMADHNVEEAHQSLMKAQDILTQLSCDLDMQYEISARLQALYTFFREELVQANIHKDEARVLPVLNMMVELRDVWQQAAQTARLATLERE